MKKIIVTYLVRIIICAPALYISTDHVALADEAIGNSKFIVEGGAFVLNSFSLSSYGNTNATDDWKLGPKPTVRFEWFTNKNSGWNYGVVAVPIFATFSDNLTSDLNVKGTNFSAGSEAKVTYQFHNLRFTSNYSFFSSGNSFLRIGGSIIARYLNFKVQSQGKSATNVNFIAFPILNIDGQIGLSSNTAIHLRLDTFPTANGVDGLYDFMVGYKMDRVDSYIEVALRAFWGGYSPDEASENNNRIAFIGPTLRYGF